MPAVYAVIGFIVALLLIASLVATGILTFSLITSNREKTKLEDDLKKLEQSIDGIRTEDAAAIADLKAQISTIELQAASLNSQLEACESSKSKANTTSIAVPLAIVGGLILVAFLYGFANSNKKKSQRRQNTIRDALSLADQIDLDFGKSGYDSDEEAEKELNRIMAEDRIERKNNYDTQRSWLDGQLQSI